MRPPFRVDVVLEWPLRWVPVHDGTSARAARSAFREHAGEDGIEPAQADEATLLRARVRLIDGTQQVRLIGGAMQRA
jgi:hypothetical protein